MARTYVKLAEVVEAFFDNGSEPPGYVWKAIAEHADSNSLGWRRGDLNMLEGDNGTSTFPEGMVVNSDGDALRPSHVAALIRDEVVDWWEEERPRSPYDDLTLSNLFVHRGKLAEWCQSIDVVCPNLTGARGKGPASKGKHRGPQRLGFPPAVDVQADDVGPHAPSSGSGSKRWLHDVVTVLLAVKPSPTKAKLVAAVLALDPKVSKRQAFAAWEELAPEDSKRAGRRSAEIEAP